MVTTITTQKKSSYLREVQNELKKVSWTSRSELIASAKAVILATFLFGLGIYACDLVIRGVIDAIGILMRAVFG